MYDSYGDLAGFNTFAGANDVSEVPVVRYQDLHRKHAPASAGAVAVYGEMAPPPEFGADPMADEENLDGYGDVAYGDVAYGDVAYGGATRGNGAVAPLPVPTNVPVYAPQGGYGAYDPPERNPDVFALEGYPELSYLGQGMRHPDDLVPYVAVAQRLLVQQGAMSPTKTDGRASADGIFGDDTRLAVEAFQRTANLPVTGTIDWDTWTALYNLRGRKVRRRTGAQYGATPTAQESLYLRNLPALSEGIHLTNPDYETYIKQAQNLLIGQGALAAKTASGDSNADGKFGPTTKTAVNKFKTAKGISPVNGVIDYPTWLALYNLTEEPAPAKKADDKKKSGKGKGKGKDEEEERGSFWESFQATTGLSQFVDGDKQMVSGNGSTPPPPPPGVDWGKVALWGGVAVGGIALTYIIVRAVQNKKE